MLKKLNELLICDSDETPSATDYIFFYGMSVMVFIVGVFFFIGIFKG